MVIVVKAFVVKLGITQCNASITGIVNLYKEKEEWERHRAQK